MFGKARDINNNAIGVLLRKNKDVYTENYLVDTPTYIPVSIEWTEVELQFTIPTPIIYHDGSKGDIICNGHQENISNVQIVFNAPAGKKIEIANPRILFNN